MRQFSERYGAWAPRSGELFAEASRYVPAGAGSSARTVRFGWRPYPPFVASGRGSRLTDSDGHEYVDYLLGLGPMILGHRHPVVTDAVTRAIQEIGTCPGLPYELEIVAARKVTEAVPGIELVRFSNSGSEVVGTAIRLARAHTGRPLVIRFEGHYHGWQDTVYWSNHVDPELAGPSGRPRPVPSGPGVPAELEATLTVLTWNDPEGFVAVMEERGPTNSPGRWPRPSIHSARKPEYRPSPQAAGARISAPARSGFPRARSAHNPGEARGRRRVEEVGEPQGRTQRVLDPLQELRAEQGVTAVREEVAAGVQVLALQQVPPEVDQVVVSVGP